MPASDDTLAIGAAIFAAATWIVPFVRMALQKKAKFSLHKVGQVLGFFALAGVLSAVTLLIAILALLFSPTPGWGWFSIAAIAAYWPLLFMALYIGNRLDHRRRKGTDGT